jgi:hypothetical protein
MNNDKRYDSIALQVKAPEDMIIFGKALENDPEIMRKGIQPKIKNAGSDADIFAVNLVRFFDSGEKQKALLFQKVCEENEKLRQKKPLSFTITKLSLVISDNYLSNPDPRIGAFEI